MRRLRDLPDLRWNKILAIRTALRNDTYDVDERLARTVESMQSEFIDVRNR